MNNSINLLPKDERQKANAGNTSKTISVVTAVVVVLLVLVIGAGTVLILTQRNKERALTEERQGLLSEIERFSQTEQQLVLIKDRITVAQQEVLTNTANKDTFGLYKQLFSTMPEGVTFYEQSIGEAENVYVVRATSALRLRDYIRSIVADDTYVAVDINELTYNPLYGYEVALTVQ